MNWARSRACNRKPNCYEMKGLSIEIKCAVNALGEMLVIQIREFQNTPQDYEDLAHIINTVWPESTHTVAELREWDEERLPQFVHRRFTGEMDDRVVGYGSFEQNPKFYHPQRFWIRLDVLPDRRQQRVGGQLYEHILMLLRSEYRAKELHTVTTESRAESIRFLTKRGFQISQRDPKSRLDVASFDRERLHALDAKIATAGVKIKALSDLMQEDVDALHQVYELHQTLVNDVPEPAGHTRVDFDSWCEGYSSANPYFIPEANFIALYRGCDENMVFSPALPEKEKLCSHTELSTDRAEYIGLTSLWGELSSNRLYTGMTGVKRAYRRKGIATALKLRAISYAQAHGTRLLMTSNNSENPMYLLNLKLGFQPYDVEIKLVKNL